MQAAAVARFELALHDLQHVGYCPGHPDGQAHDMTVDRALATRETHESAQFSPSGSFSAICRVETLDPGARVLLGGLYYRVTAVEHVSYGEFPGDVVYLDLVARHAALAG